MIRPERSIRHTKQPVQKTIRGIFNRPSGFWRASIVEGGLETTIQQQFRTPIKIETAVSAGKGEKNAHWLMGVPNSSDGCP